jgi:hypothetical protein|tara:strand:+ start:1161 stop:1448 length:288 start_codon:yes stop_codon:yes gene_type:complete
MIMKINPFLKILLPLFIAACASDQKTFPEANSPDAQLFKKVCSDCHRQTSSWRARTAAEWDETVDVMLRHMEGRGVAYDKEEIQTIRAYLRRNAN